MTPPTLRLELFVTNLTRSARFYQSVMGFHIVKQEPDYISLQLGTIVLGFGLYADLPAGHPAKSPFSERRGLGVEIVIEVDDVAAFLQYVLAQGVPATQLVRRKWGCTDFRLVDPDGYYLRVTSR